MITADQKKQLLEAGYTIGKSGNTVLSKSGGSVGGYNKNGGLWSGSAKVKAILKSEPKEVPKKAAKEAPKKTPKKASKKAATEKPVSKNAMTGYGAGDVVTTRLGGGRGDGRAERVRRSADAALDKADKESKGSEKEKLGAFFPGVAALISRLKGERAKSVGSPSNPNYKGGKSRMKPGFQGKYETNLARTEGRGVRSLGYAPGMKNLAGGSGGAGRTSMTDSLNSRRLMNKGGMVKANCGASMKPTQSRKK